MKILLRSIDTVKSFGFSLVTASILYLIIDSVASLIDGPLLDWTFCGVAHDLAGVEWCGIEPATEGISVDYVIFHLLNIPLPWVIMFFGLFLVGFCTLLLALSNRPKNMPLTEGNTEG